MKRQLSMRMTELILAKRHLRNIERIRKLEHRLEAREADQGLQNMLRAHVAYLDHLTAESAAQDLEPVNFRTMFTTWYLQHRPKS